MILGFLGFYIAVPPSVTVHPGSKMRIIGQSVTFCCEGAGNPPPDIEWYALLIVGGAIQAGPSIGYMFTKCFIAKANCFISH